MKYFLLLVFLCGCATQPQEVKVIEPFTIRLIPLGQVRREGKELSGRWLNGYCLPFVREIIVPYSGFKDINGNPLPDFEVLGHEIWHLEELGGRWHK